MQVPRWICCINCVGSMLEEGVSMSNILVAGWRGCDKNLCRRLEYHITRNLFNLSRTKKKKKAFTEKTYHCPCVWANLTVFNSLSLFICTFQIIKGKEKKLIIYLYISIFVFLCYTIEPPSLPVFRFLSLYLKLNILFHLPKADKVTTRWN